MKSSLSGFIYLFNSSVIALLTYRFFLNWKKEKSYVAKIFFYCGTLIVFFCFIAAIGGIFFADNPVFLKGVVVNSTFSQGLAFAFLGSLIVYLKFPQISPHYGFLLIFLLILITTILAAILPFNPYLTEKGWIDWDIPPSIGILRFSTTVVALFPLVVVFFQQSFFSKALFVKTKGLGLGLIIFLGFLSAGGLFVLGESSPLNDLWIGILGIIVLFFFVFISFNRRKSNHDK